MRKTILTVGCLVFLTAGCGGSNAISTPAQQDEGNLRQVGDMYLAYQLANKKAPTKFSDFASVRAVSGNGYDAVQSGAVVLRYGVTLTDTTEEGGSGPADEVLAYQKDVPEKGGKVLMLNRTTRTMTAEEFKSAKLAGTGSSAPSDSKPKGK
jgi:hypothetical protein